MNTIHYNDIVQLPLCVATIGFFDGVHRGHQFLIHHLVETARKDGLQSTVITLMRIHARYCRQIISQRC